MIRKKILRPIFRVLPIPQQYKIKMRQQLFHLSSFIKNEILYYLKNWEHLADFPSFKPLDKSNTLPDILIFSVIDWDFRIQRPQHLAQALAKQGHRVFYISNNFSNQISPGLEVKPLSDTLPLYWVKLGLAGAPAIYGGDLPTHGLEQLVRGLAACLLWANVHQLVSIVQHPFWNTLAFALPDCHVVYDCMDHHAGFNETSTLTLEKEKYLIKNAHLVLTSAQSLYEEAILANPSVALIRNATDYDFFSRKPDVIYNEHQKIIGYYGAIAEWFDENLVDALANAFPEYTILLIGNDTAEIQKKLKSHQNIIFTGEVAYEKLPYYLYAFDVCIIPFKVIPLTLATNPVKAYEYLSAGKPVVSVNLPELHEFSNLIKLADNYQEFIQQIKDALDEDSPQKMIERKNFASQQTWMSRASDIQKSLSNIKEPMVSIIILTYNNLDLTKACLESVEKNTGYNNIEVIIVDNASTDNTPDFLTKNYLHKKNYQLILNNNNLGFAAGNNVGLKIAQGEYLVLLNNDTRVTSGWVRTMVNHFKHHSKVGLLGPVTNNIGNDAKIYIRHRNPDKIFPEARKIALKNMGRLLPIKTLAFFCVMMPREVFQKVGFLDESFGLGFFEDDDYCRRVQQKGYETFCAEDVFIYHHLSASFDQVKIDIRQKLFEENKKIYESKWGKWEPHKYR